MRTTVTLADDVAAELERLRRERSIGVSEALNELARAGMVRRKEPRKKFVQRTYSMGMKIDVTNIGEVLELLEGPEYRDPLAQSARGSRRALAGLTIFGAAARPQSINRRPSLQIARRHISSAKPSSTAAWPRSAVPSPPSEAWRTSWTQW
jgi:hypothetical protein